MKKIIRFLVVLALFSFSQNGISQVVVTPGVTVSQVNNGSGGGPLGRTGGVTFTFTKTTGNFDACTYWGFQAGSGGDIAANMGNIGACTFGASNYYSYSAGDGTNTITLTGSSTVIGYTATGSSTSQTVSQRAYVSSTSGTFVVTGGNVYMNVSGLNSFNVTVRMEGYGPSMGYNSGSNYNGQWRPIVQLYDGISNHSSYTVCTSFDSDFYAYSEIAATAITGGTTPVCIGSSPGTLMANYTGGSTNIGYQWYVNGSAVPGATSSTYTAPNISATTTYRVDITDSCIAYPSYMRTVSSPNFVVNMTAGTIVSGTSAPNQSICYKGVPNDITTSGYSGGTISKWQIDDNAGFTSPTDIAITTNTITGAQILTAIGGDITSTQYVRAIITTTGCSAGSAAAIIYVNDPDNLTAVEDTANCTIDGTGGWMHFYNKNTRNIIASLNSNGQNLGSTTVKVYQHGGNSIFANTIHNCWTKHAVMNRSFVIDVANAPTSSVDLRLYFTDSELAELIDSSLTSHSTGGATNYGLNDPGVCENDDDVLSIAGLVVTQVSGATNEDGNFDPDDGVFIAHNTSNNGIGNATYGANYVQFDVDSFSEFWIHGSETFSALPVDLLNFTAKLITDKDVSIDWNTSNEVDLSHFVIDRKKEGQSEFTAIAQIDAIGYSSSLQGYNHIDPINEGGRYYYRLKSVNNDGTGTLSSIRTVLVEVGQNVVQFSPNPSENKIKLRMADNDVYHYTIIDTKGKIIQRGQTQNQAEINIEKIASGTYTIQFTKYGTLMQTSKLSILK